MDKVQLKVWIERELYDAIRELIIENTAASKRET